MSKQTSTGSTLIASGATFMALTPIFVAMAGANAATTTLGRCGIAALVMLPWVWRELRSAGAASARLLICSALAGLLLGVDLMLYTESLRSAGAGVASLVLNTHVLAFPLLALVLDQQAISRRFLLAAPVLLAGVALTGGLGMPGAGMGPDVTRGALLGAAAGLAFSGYLYLSRRAVQGSGPTTHQITSVTVSSASAAAAALVLAPVAGGLDMHLPLTAWAWLLALAVISQSLAYGLVSAGSTKVPAHISSALLVLNPIVAVLLSMLLLGDVLSATQLVGGLLVLIAMAGATITPKTKAAASELRGESSAGTGFPWLVHSERTGAELSKIEG